MNLRANAIAIAVTLAAIAAPIALARAYERQGELNSQLIETQRQLAATNAARIKYREALADAQAGALVRQSQMEKEIADYEARLRAEGRACRLNRSDVEWLHR